MKMEWRIHRRDEKPLGTRASVESTLMTEFPDIRFVKTASGKEKLRVAAERGIDLPAPVRSMLENLPSLSEGFVDRPEFKIWFGLGPAEDLRALEHIELTTMDDHEQACVLLEKLAATLSAQLAAGT